MCFGRGKRVRRAAWARFFLLRSASGCLSVCCCAGILISAPLRYFLFLFRSQRQSGDATFLAKRKWPKIGQRGFPFGNPVGPRTFCGRSGPFGASRPSRGDQSPHVPPCPPGGINLRNGVEQIASQRGLPRPRSIFGHFLLIKKVASGELRPARAKVCRKILPSA